MGVAVRKFPYGYKSLMHFDYPYFAEPGDGLRDEIGVLEWNIYENAVGMVKFVGTEIPVAQNVPGTPMFGYRCLQTTERTDYIYASKAGYFDMDSTKTYEIEFFIRLAALTAGNVLLILNGNNSELFKISVGTSGEIIVTSTALGINASSSNNIALTTWGHVRVRISSETFRIILNGASVYSGSCSGSLTDSLTIRLGGFNGQLDEFLFRQVYNGEVYDTIPTVPYQGYVDVRGIGGTGKQGALNLTSGTSRINTVYVIARFPDSSSLTVRELQYDSNCIGIHGHVQAGDEVMITKCQVQAGNFEPSEAGYYAFRKIKSVSGTTFTLDKPLTEFNDIASYDWVQEQGIYVYELHMIPNYTSVTIGANAVLSPRSTGDMLGGVVAFRCKGDVNIQGKILTSGFGGTRNDYFQMTHNHLPERFIINSGGGVIILSEGTVTAGDNARIGASWSGSGKGGARVYRANGNPGGSGYGGSGRSGSAASKYSGAGGVGGGGGGVCKTGSNADYEAGAAGVGGNTGGRGWGWNAWNLGGTQGTGFPNSLGGGGTLQDSHYSSGTYGSYAYAGASVMIICKKLKVSMNAISTGGAGGTRGTGANNEFASGGGGSGMCYLAYEEAE